MKFTYFFRFFMNLSEFLEKNHKNEVYLARDLRDADEAEIKEKWSPRHGDHGPLITRDVSSSWTSKLFKRNGRLRYLAINSSINESSLLQKCNS